MKYTGEVREFRHHSQLILDIQNECILFSAKILDD